MNLKLSLSFIVVWFFTQSSFAQTAKVQTGRFGLKYTYVSTTTNDLSIDNYPNHKLKVENVSNLKRTDVTVSFTGTNADFSVPPLSGGGFAVFPNGGNINLRVGDTTVVQGWSTGWNECSCLTNGSNSKYVRYIFSMDSTWYGPDGLPDGTVTISDTLFQPVTIISSANATSQLLSYIMRNPSQQLKGKVVIPEYILSTTSLSYAKIATNGASWSFYPPSSSYITTTDSLNNRYINFNLTVDPRTDYRLEFGFTSTNSSLYIPPVNIVVTGSSSQTALFATALPYGKAIFSVDSVVTYNSSTGYWRSVFADGDSTVTVFPGQENWFGTTTTEKRLHMGDSKIIKYKVDNTNYGTQSWEYKVPTETWGGSVSKDGKYVVYMIKQRGLEMGLENDPTVDWIGVLDGTNGAKLWTLRGDLNTMVGMEVGISSTGTYIAVGSTGIGRVTLYKNNRTSGTLQWTNPVDFVNGNTDIGQVRKLVFSADDQYLYVGSGDMYLRKYRVSDGTLIWKSYIGGWPFVNGLVISNGYIYTGTKSRDRTIIKETDGSVVYLSEGLGYDVTVASTTNTPIYGFGAGVTEFTSGRIIASIGGNAVKHAILNGSFVLMADRTVDVYSKFGGLPLASRSTYMGTGNGEQSQSGWASSTGDRIMLTARDLVSGIFPRKGIAFYRINKQINRYPTIDSIKSKSFAQGDTLRFKITYADYNDYNTANTSITVSATSVTNGINIIVRVDSIIVYASAGFAGTGTIKVKVSETTTTENFQVWENVPISVTGTCTSPAAPTASNISYCANATATALTATAPAGSTLLWYTAATGGTGSATAPTPLTTTAGITKYYASATIGGFCESTTRTEISVTINAVPAKPTITKDVSGNLLSSATSGNQWYLSGVAISGATGTSYKPSADGIISVKVTQNGCVSIVSDNFTYVITAIANFENGQYIKFYPNPVQNELKINFNLIGQSNISIKIFNNTGKLILANDKISSGANINLKSLIIGTYIVQVQDKNGKLVFTDKLIKE